MTTLKFIKSSCIVLLLMLIISLPGCTPDDNNGNVNPPSTTDTCNTMVWAVAQYTTGEYIRGYVQRTNDSNFTINAPRLWVQGGRGSGYEYYSDASFLPPFLQVTSVTGHIEWNYYEMTIEPGTYNFSLRITDGYSGENDTLRANYSIEIIEIDTLPLPCDEFRQYDVPGFQLNYGRVGVCYETSLPLNFGCSGPGSAGLHGPFNWVITEGSPPPGLTLNAASGVISGRPKIGFEGTYTFRVKVTNNLGQEAACGPNGCPQFEILILSADQPRN